MGAMNEEMKILADVASRLEGAGIEYMMTGSMAMAIYSTPRMTRDIDIIIKVAAPDVAAIVSLFQNDFYIDEAAVRRAIEDKRMFNIIHSDSIIKVDFIVRKDEEYRIVEFSRKKKYNVNGAQIWVVSPEDLVLSKLVWAKTSESELQLGDIRQILFDTTSIDREYLEKWAAILGVEHLLSKVKNRA
jgi:hypothetical protein